MSPNLNNQNPGKGTGETGRKGIGKSRSLEEPVEERRTTSDESRPEKKKSVSSLVDELLSDIYGKAELKRKQSVTTGGDWSWHESDQRSRSNLKQIEAKCWLKGADILKEEISALESLIAEESNNLVKYLKRKDHLLARREAHYDVITAVIHAISRKTRDDMKMKFSLTPGTETGFSQWLDAMKMVAQLPGGVPSEFRTKLWLQLSERHLSEQNIDWERAEAIIFNEWTNPDDEELGVQIVKDLHRTGCSLFCGAQEQNQAVLKRVLLAYARWNKNVGYCQGFNMLAALILQVMDRDEKNAVKVMIYLIEGVLPESYFANNLRGLSVDMAVFRDLLRLRLPKLSKHLEALQNDTNSGTSYEPPLTNVFTMQWFLTLFSNCLPQQTVLRVWDLVFLHGNEVLLRTALAIWGILQERIMSVESADEFYSIMGVVTREMLEFGLMDANNLIKMIVMVDPFPNELQELREKYLYNISPWTQSVQSAARKGIKLFYSDPEDQDDTEDEDKIALATAYGVFRRRESGSRDVQPMGPTLDISVLKQQYAKLRQRQRQAHIIISAACSSSIPANLSSVPTVSVNHLLMGKSALVNKGRRIGPPEGSIPPPKNRTVKGAEVGKQKRVTVSGETLDWKDAEKRKCSTTESKKISNTDRTLANNKLKTKSIESCNGLNRVGHFGEEEDDDEEEGSKRRSSTSSASSTSTELCDDEFHRLSDFDMEDSNPVSEEPAHNPPAQSVATKTGRDEEIRERAAELVRDIEEAVNRSERLRHLKNPGMIDATAEDETDSPSASNHDNTKSSGSSGDVEKEFLKTEPEVPISGDAAVTVDEENRIFDRSKPDADESRARSRRERDRRKSDLALSVIKENIEMLSRFTQKSGAREGDAKESEEARRVVETAEVEQSVRVECRVSGEIKRTGLREEKRVTGVCEEDERPRSQEKEKSTRAEVKRDEDRPNIPEFEQDRQKISIVMGMENEEGRPKSETVIKRGDEIPKGQDVGGRVQEEEDRPKGNITKLEHDRQKMGVTREKEEEERSKRDGIRERKESKRELVQEEDRQKRDVIKEVRGVQDRPMSERVIQQEEAISKRDMITESQERKEDRSKRDTIREVQERKESKRELIQEEDRQKRDVIKEVRGVQDRPMSETLVQQEEVRLKIDAIREVQERKEDRLESKRQLVQEEDTQKRDVIKEVRGVQDLPLSETVLKREERSKRDGITEVEKHKEDRLESKRELIQEEDRQKRDVIKEVRGVQDLPKSETVMQQEETRSKRDGIRIGAVEEHKEDRLESKRELVQEEDRQKKDVIREVRGVQDLPLSETVIKREERSKRDGIREVEEHKDGRLESKRELVQEEDRQKRDVVRVVKEDKEKEDRPKIEATGVTKEKLENGKTDPPLDHVRTAEDDATEPKTVSRVNKEVNTDITIATDLDASPSRSLEAIQKKDQGNLDEFLINLRSTKPVHKSPESFKQDRHIYLGSQEKDKVRPFGRDDLAERWKKESERIESKIEMSKSDWDLKMKRIAELESTTREKLNELKSKSIVHRHRSLDRYDGRDREKRKSPIPRIQVPEDDAEDLEKRKKRISALSFDEITSRTEKLLGANLNLDRKFRKSIDEDEEVGKTYEYYSSPTSPEYRGRRRADYSSPKRYEARWKHNQPAEEDWLTITEESGGRHTVDLTTTGRRAEKAQSPIGAFNPFPTRAHSRPKELGVRLGMYPPSPEGGHSSKRSH